MTHPLLKFPAAAAFLVVIAVSATLQAQPSTVLAKDAPGATDHPLTGRYSGAVILSQTTKAFDELTLPSGAAQAQKFATTVQAQGKVTRTIYIAPQGRSSLEVASNYAATIASNGFKSVFTCAASTCGDNFSRLKYRWNLPGTKVVGAGYEHRRKLMVEAVLDQLVDVRYTLFQKTAPEGPTYIGLYSGLHQGGGFGDSSKALSDRAGVLVEIVEPRPIEQKMVVLQAADISTRVASEGRAIFYGILFDFDKADLKAASDAQLLEMARYLQANASARVFIVGHTDNTGTLERNLTLSTQRAEAVARALVSKHKIDAGRIQARGIGPLSPVATNTSEAGRAKNRRVEMVGR